MATSAAVSRVAAGTANTWCIVGTTFSAFVLGAALYLHNEDYQPIASVRSITSKALHPFYIVPLSFLVYNWARRAKEEKKGTSIIVYRKKAVPSITIGEL